MSLSSSPPSSSLPLIAENATVAAVDTPPPTSAGATKRANPFTSRINAPTLTRASLQSTDSVDGFQLAQLSDLDIRLIAQAEIVAILIEHIAHERQSDFKTFLPLFLPKVRRLMQLSPAKRTRYASAEFLERLDREWDMSA